MIHLIPACQRVPGLISRQLALLRAVLSLCAAVLLASCAQEEGTEPAAAAKPLPNFAETKAKAETGDPQAQDFLGQIYAEGKQVKQDYREAVQWYRKAAEKNLPLAQYHLGILHEIGQGVSRDEAEAARWYQKAAEQGLSDAQYNLASMYGLGRGVPFDPKEALKWYERAAAQGDGLARFQLAERYERGKNVPQDFPEAYKWYSLAAESGFKDGEAARKRMKKYMTSAQETDGKKRLQEYKTAHAAQPAR